ncbi:helicase-related protein, partial [Acidianus ambivalens]
KSEIEEILRKYKNECTGELSLVFFRSIAEAHNYSAPLGIPEHHSRVNRTERQKLEEEMKNNTVNIVSSVKTLQQGIDIGQVKRVIHVGIPLLVKDFRQREGRKGRREDIDFVESILIPQGFDPRLYDGINSLLTWSSISPEIVVFNINNYYLTLWDALNKLCNSQPLSNQEEAILRRFNMIDSSGKPTKGNICNSVLRFYDIQGDSVKVFFGDPPQQVDNISFKDMIENYQPGSIDISNNAVVTKIEKNNSFNVYESDINNVNESCISLAIREYNATLYKWGIAPNISYDIKLGKVISKVYT